jgi:putative PIN family toxin of toxin-antitoxin system
VIVVLDTNVIMAALLAKGLCHDVFTLLIKNRALASSPALLTELDETIKRKFEPRPKTRLFLARLRRQVRLVEPAPLPAPACRDPDDDVVLATALEARANFIVTGDNDLLTLKQFQGVRIVSPREFWLLLQR